MPRGRDRADDPTGRLADVVHPLEPERVEQPDVVRHEVVHGEHVIAAGILACAAAANVRTDDAVARGKDGHPLAGKHPVVVTDFFAYRLLQYATTGLPEPLAERGYVTLTCSPRGSGGSSGAWRPFEQQESQDNYDLIEWAAAQPWSTGKITSTAP